MFTAVGDRVVVDLEQRDRHLIGQLPAVLAESTDDPAGRILDRPVHPDDPDASDDYRRLTGPAISLQRAEDRAVAFGIADGQAELSADEARSLLRCMNEARLVLAARAGAFDEGQAWEERMGEDPMLAIVGWLGYLQSRLLEALDPRG